MVLNCIDTSNLLLSLGASDGYSIRLPFVIPNWWPLSYVTFGSFGGETRRAHKPTGVGACDGRTVGVVGLDGGVVRLDRGVVGLDREVK